MFPTPVRICLCQTFGVLLLGTLVVSQLLCSTHAKDTDTTSQVIQRDGPKGITTTFYTCIDKAGSDTVALGACLSAEKTTQDSRLNSTYKTLLGKLNDQVKDKLIIA